VASADAIAYADRTSIVRTNRLPIPGDLLRRLNWEPGQRFAGKFTPHLELTPAPDGEYKLSRVGLVGPARKFKLSPGHVAAFELVGQSLRVTRINGKAHESYRKPALDDDGVPIPPSWLTQAFTSKPDALDYLQGGTIAAKMVTDLAATGGVTVTSKSRVLDFGCGAGRVARSLRKSTHAELVGYDLYAPAIRWCQAHMSFGRWEHGLSEPPLKEENESFDLIYAISVLTHLNEAHQDLWLAEWKRLLRPGGVLIATFRSEQFIEQFIRPRSTPYADKISAALSAAGFAHVTDEGWAGVFPDFYNDSFHTPDYVKARWGRELEIVGIHPPAAFPGSRQDVAVLRKALR